MAFVFSGPDLGELYRLGLTTQQAQASTGQSLRAQDIASNQFWANLAENRLTRNQAINERNIASAENQALFKFNALDSGRKEVEDRDWRNRQFKFAEDKFKFEKDYADKALSFKKKEDDLRMEQAEDSANFQNAVQMASGGKDPKEIFGTFDSLSPTQKKVVESTFGQWQQQADLVDNATDAMLADLETKKQEALAKEKMTKLPTDWGVWIDNVRKNYRDVQGGVINRLTWDPYKLEFVPRYMNPNHKPDTSWKLNAPAATEAEKPKGNSLLKRVGMGVEKVIDLHTPTTDPRTWNPTYNTARFLMSLGNEGTNAAPAQPKVMIMTDKGPKMVNQSDAARIQGAQ